MTEVNVVVIIFSAHRVVRTLEDNHILAIFVRNCEFLSQDQFNCSSHIKEIKMIENHWKILLKDSHNVSNISCSGEIYPYLMLETKISNRPSA